ncbi:hypothetical protein [Longibacter salinarum]|nr:hypothetical protein [Longibacter salinarum]
MLHIVRMIQKRYPEHGDTIVLAIVVSSGAALVAGIALLLA